MGDYEASEKVRAFFDVTYLPTYLPTLIFIEIIQFLPVDPGKLARIYTKFDNIVQERE